MCRDEEKRKGGEEGRGGREGGREDKWRHKLHKSYPNTVCTGDKALALGSCALCT